MSRLFTPFGLAVLLVSLMGLIVFPTVVWAQMAASTPATWGMILGFAINAVGTMLVVKLLAYGIPYLRAQIPVSLPIIAGAIGPLLALVQTKLAALTGVPISLGVDEILAMFSGGTSIAIAQVFIQQKRQTALRGAVGVSKLPPEGAPI